MKITRFEDIDSWREGRILSNLIYQSTGKGKFRLDFGLRDQICRAVVSVTSNIAEGFEAQTNSEFICFLTFARRSCSEVKSQLYVALDNEYISEIQFVQMYDKATEVSKLINGFIRYLKTDRYRKQ
jgi:four helix bundle protein